ncbi:ATP-dependent nuclease [Vibrio vulnificus]|uniref:ATP-dependent nuclease n=2 Tax=Vibrio vulnificus TaxID=672 RepID=UPI000501188A|nr:AAA family ATPase [Vibrio vulnificus]EGR0638068.1 hypothetical protein [Vibrio vulnificus]EGR0647255.1 hypothetical protein [Vibrio vulnificus]EID4441413.1 AAA family ATPase [Vibrio vulnificus]EKA6050158.1 AAA family ATPase [Vibrio vulnificus]KGK72373.1 hypothetical protein NA76_00710 [Vibrio vulnificus]
MIDRKAKIDDNWSLVRSRKGFQYHIELINVAESDLTASMSIEVGSAMISLCGKNGAGKSSILKAIYYSLIDELNPALNKSIGSVVKVRNKNGGKLNFYGNGCGAFDNVLFLDPSDESINIRRLISSDSTFMEDYVECGDESSILDEVIGYIKKILSKDITSVSVIEVEGKLPEGEVLPYLKIYKPGNEYGSLDMGQGEHKILYLIWRLFTVNPNSIVLIEEPEAFLCSKSQEYFMDFLAYIIGKKKLHIILSTHSDIVLKKQHITYCSIVKRTPEDKATLIKESSKSKYLEALGLKPIRRGIFLVEDRFAKLFLEEMFLYYSSTLSNEYYIDILHGESHILELVKHYNSDNLLIVPILDADMIGKVKDCDCKVPINYLPSNNKTAPEEEIIDFIKRNQLIFAEAIPLDTETCLEAVRNNFSNHHDWFEELDTVLDLKNQKMLEKIAIKLWIESNVDKVSKFILLLESIGIRHNLTIESESEKLFVRLNDHRFELCGHSHDTYNLKNFVGKKVGLSVICDNEHIRCRVITCP